LLAAGLASDTWAKPKPVIAVSTTMLEMAVSDLFGDQVVIAPIVPPDACPGNYDLKPKDLAALAGAQVIVLHAFQTGIKNKLVAGGFGDKPILSVPDRASLATPPGYLYLLEYLAAHLPETLPELAGPAQAGLAEARARLEQARARAETVAGDRLQGRAVVVATFQKEFVSFYRMEPVAVIGNGELSARELDELVAAARERGAVAVVGNQQSGRKGFEAVAELLGLPLVMLSNFPERRDGRLDYSAFLLANVQALVDGVGRK
jgi:ABC-type Zn uptake system ZnuABC Zn-binding protein ZnuA